MKHPHLHDLLKCLSVFSIAYSGYQTAVQSDYHTSYNIGHCTAVYNDQKSSDQSTNYTSVDSSYNIWYNTTYQTSVCNVVDTSDDETIHNTYQTGDQSGHQPSYTWNYLPVSSDHFTLANETNELREKVDWLDADICEVHYQTVNSTHRDTDRANLT